jgi:hypothetical protein
VSRDSQIALALVESLDDRALDVLADALAPRLAASTAPPAPVAYTVASLAGELGLSERAVRAAIHRGELHAASVGTVPSWRRRLPGLTGSGRVRATTKAARQRLDAPGPAQEVES